MRSCALVVVAALGLAGCASAPTSTQIAASAIQEPIVERVKPTDFTKAQRSVVERAVTKVLKDPESARFRTMTAGIQSDGVTIVCGLVNSKNSFGGYTGRVAYYGEFRKDGSLPDVWVDSSREPAAAEVCRKSGLILD